MPPCCKALSTNLGSLIYQPFRPYLPTSAAYLVTPHGLSSKLLGLPSNPPESRFDETKRKQLLDSLPGSLAAQVGGIGQRRPPQEVQDLVVALCAQQDWAVEELSTLLRRNPEVVRQSYLRPLMREGRLAMTRPDEPNSPDQTYRAVEGVKE